MSVLLNPFRFASFSPLDLSLGLWIDPSDESTVTIDASSGAYIGATGLVCSGVTANIALLPTAGVSTPLVDIDCRVKATTSDWTPTNYRGLVSCRLR
jgi:hypothetical protein